MDNIYKNICVFCASSAKVDAKYTDAAYKLGALMAQNDISCVCGAGRSGLMRAVSDGEIDNGGKVIGVIPEFMVENGWCYDKLTETIIAPDMHERKERMSAISDAVVALPGGCGTLEELLEIITWKQLGLFHKPIMILNVDGFYDPLLDMLKKCIDEHFMKESHSSLWHVVSEPADVIAVLENIDRDNDDIVECKY